MGLLFNTEQTTKMLALVNRHFAEETHGGGFNEWRQRRDEVKPSAGNKLLALAQTYAVQPDRNEDKLSRARGRWKKWLTKLDGVTVTNLPANEPNPPSAWPTVASGDHIAPTGTAIPVDREIRRQIFNALSDPNCIEIAFSVVPSTVVSVDDGHCILAATPSNAHSYIYLLTINTQRVDEF